ncbi:MAG TPA: hypothetical protein VFA07_17335 [Chthonomonadaceae bacterium]|nr:hypothetical protein [Chthonomonadaceae bacterium]
MRISTRPDIRCWHIPFLCLLLLILGRPSQGQIPKITTFFPTGGKAGTTVDVEIRGASLDGANTLLVDGKGLAGTIEPGGNKVDETYKPLWQSKCQACHELRSPANRSMTPAQWAATVERMVKVHQAPISADEAAKITQYLEGAARAGRITAQIKIPPDTLPGVYEVRVVTPRGVSTAAPFEVGTLPETFAVNNKIDQAQPVTLPCVVNGCFSNNAERHFFKFSAKKGQRLVFDLKAFRYHPQDQEYFNPNLRLYDSTGKELVENHGYYELDPLIDWDCPADGDYTLEVRDLLWRGNPGSVYRLTMGTVPYDTVLYPPAAQAGSRVSLAVAGKGMEGQQTGYTLSAPDEPGVETVGSPVGPNAIYVSPYPLVHDGMQSRITVLPAVFAGRIARAGAAETFYLQGKGRFEFEGYAERLSSPIHLSATLLDPKGKPMASLSGDRRMAANLQAGQTYMLRVADADGLAGAERVYAIEARPARPELECVAQPDNVTLRPGLSTAVEVILRRRAGVDGDVTVTAEGLPPGVTAAPSVIQPDRDRTWLVLTAAPDAAPSAKPFQVVATARGPAGEIRTDATPQEVYLFNNQPFTIDRNQCVLAVQGQPEFTASLESEGPVKVDPKKGTEIKVRIKRSAGFKGGITARIYGLPNGWDANAESVGSDKDEITLLVRPNGGDPRPFLKRNPEWTPIRAVVEVYSDEFRFIAGTFLVQKADHIDMEELDR